MNMQTAKLLKEDATQIDVYVYTYGGLKYSYVRQGAEYRNTDLSDLKIVPI